jgi:hypothetical protein
MALQPDIDHMNNSNDAIVICTERNFEWKSRLLVRSIRAFGHDLSSVRILSYSPCFNSQPSGDCLDEFRSLDVETIATPLNMSWPKYKLANKVLACAHAEQSLNLDRIAFLDSDQIVVSGFEALFERSSPFSARPVDVKNIGVLNSSEGEAFYWNALYHICGAKNTRTVTTTVCRSLIREYFDSGMFSVNAKAGILTAWKNNFIKVWMVGLRPSTGDYFVEQSCLSATASAMAEQLLILPNGYNLPLEGLYQESFAGLQRLPIEGNPVSLHYHRLFDDARLEDILRFVATFLDYERCSWIRSNLKELRPAEHHGAATRERPPQREFPWIAR